MAGKSMAIKKKIRPLSEKKRKSILDQAARLFLKDGFGATSMDEISEAACVSKRTLYNHFPTKKILFREIIKLEWQKVSYRKIHKPHIHKPEDIFTAIMEHVLKTMYSARMQNLLKLVIAESGKFPELRILQAEYGVEPLIDDFTAYIEYLNEKGVLKVDNPRIAVAQYIGLVKECLYWPWLLGVIAKPSEKHQKEIIQRANKIFFAYYRAR
jgi:TetR/AcrR family transcriptional regulator of autoinduction and epiphytic fitness